MARKLNVANIVQVPVTLQLPDETGKNITHRFTLVCDRLTQAELRSAARDGVPDADVALMKRVTKDWRDQRLVLEDSTGEPSPFSDDALADLLSIVGVPGICVAAYAREVEAKAKN